MIIYTFLSVTVATRRKQEETGAKKENTRATAHDVVTIGQTALRQTATWDGGAAALALQMTARTG